MLLNNKEGFVSFMADPFFVPFQFVKWPYFLGSVTIVLHVFMFNNNQHHGNIQNLCVQTPKKGRWQISSFDQDLSSSKICVPSKWSVAQINWSVAQMYAGTAFVASFLFCGINMVDLYHLKKPIAGLICFAFMIFQHLERILNFWNPNVWFWIQMFSISVNIWNNTFNCIAFGLQMHHDRRSYDQNLPSGPRNNQFATKDAIRFRQFQFMKHPFRHERPKIRLTIEINVSDFNKFNAVFKK